MTNLSTSLGDLSLEGLFPQTLTDVSCPEIQKNREVWVATEMCAQYLESTIDAIIVRGDDNKLAGIVGGYDLLDAIRKNPTRDFQYTCAIEEIMFKDFLQVEKKTKFKDLMEKWKNTRRAFAVISNNSGGYSPISARKMLEIGIRYKTDMTVSSISKKKIITFQGDEPLSKILDLMFENKTRKLLLVNSNQFISDRTILEGISRMLKFQQNIDNFLDVPINQFTFDHIKVITEDLKFDKLCSVMNKMEHPYVIYKDIVVSPWDVCLSLMNENMTEISEKYQMKRKCPHCGKNVD
ncbi:MAG: CBS domain-containing protein [Nitrosarchaeum sp.]|nr:MAG: CBS domain-containing protein [Nitrosarchaeum sp.]